MAKTSLTEIFAGDLPRIGNMVIVPDQAPQMKSLGWFGASEQVYQDHFIGFNIQRIAIDKLEAEIPPVNFVLITRRGGGFTIERGELPKCFRREFFLGYCPTFREESLPKDSERVLRQVNAIKKYQARIDQDIVGFGRYVIDGNLWAKIEGLNNILISLKSAVN